MTLAYPFDAFLEETGDLTLAQSVHELPRRVVRWHQLNAVDEPVQFLRKGTQQSLHIFAANKSIWNPGTWLSFYQCLRGERPITIIGTNLGWNTTGADKPKTDSIYTREYTKRKWLMLLNINVKVIWQCSKMRPNQIGEETITKYGTVLLLEQACCNCLLFSFDKLHGDN